jgi:Zn-dependent peptidase ImmA (M78 family)
VSTWERFAGDTARFAVRLSFEPDPDKDVFEDPAYSGSWGSLRIWVDGLDVCAHTVAGESDESVHWYLLPLVEWLAEHWDPILHEERLPAADQFATAAEAMTVEPPLPIGVDDERHYAALDEWQAWWRRHALESAADGGLFPRIFFRRWGDQIEVSWRSDGLVGAPEGLRFAAPLGRAQYPAGEVARTLYEVQDIELSDRGIRGVSLAGPGHRPSCLINASYQFGRSEQIKRFTLAHELCHLLFDRWRARRLAVASGSWAPQDIERRANAFAAAFLMPRSLLDRAAHEVDAPYASVDWLVRMAAIANTSALATLERLANLGILPEFKRDALRYELLSRSADV